jgi:N-dimethylarginine dimethylaminohydrolase
MHPAAPTNPSSSTQSSPIPIETMTAPLRQVLVCPPAHAGWNDPKRTAAWPDLGFHHPPNFAEAESQHRALCDLLTQAGAEVLTLPESKTLTLDAVYTHDATLPTSHGLILMRPGKSTRILEAHAQSAFCAQRIPTFAEIQAPATTEGGDVVWLNNARPSDPRSSDAQCNSVTLMVGQGFRTNKAGLDQLRALLATRVEVLPVPLPYGQGPSACLHLMSLMSMLDDHTILVDLPRLSVETVQHLQSRNFRLIEIDQSERDTLACNVLALGNNRLIALEENAVTNARLGAAGFDVQTFPGSELCINGGGGPTCLTRPLARW